MRWTIPTLIQQLVDQGIPIPRAVEIVAATYPETRGDTFYRWVDPTDPERIAVGVYGLWNDLRGDQSPLTGAKVSDDARTIAQFYRLNRRMPLSSVRASATPDYVIRRIADQTGTAMLAGDRFEPTEVEEEDQLPGFTADMVRTVTKLDGIGDYIRALPRPWFGA